ncbi:hypothetical protein ACFLYB_02635 [Chloroflexota bacterium]
MSAKIRRIKIAAALIFIISLVIVILAPSPVLPATTCKIENGVTVLSTQDFSAIPQSIVEDASRMAAGLFGEDRQKCDEFISQILATYLKARDKDIVVIFNAGGWGWDTVVDSHGWETIMEGIKTELSGLGHSYLILSHKRTASSINGLVSETMMAANVYPYKADDLAARADFLTRHIEGISIIFTAESNGTTICSSAFDILEDNERIYSILTGPPSWNNSSTSERALIMRSNGASPDAFSEGDIITVIRSNLEALFGISQKYAGDILFYIGAPGHYYSWEYEKVRLQITDFLRKSFGNKS